MILNKFQKKYKEYLSMQDRFDVVCSLLNDLPLIELKVPYQKGWEIAWVLKSNLHKYSADDLQRYQKLVNKCYSIRYTNDVNEVKLVRKGDTTYTNNKGNPIDITPHKKYLVERMYNELSDKDKKYFEIDRHHEAYQKYGYIRYTHHLPMGIFKLRARPYVITHTRQRGGLLEVEKDYLYNKLYHTQQYGEFTPGYFGGSYPKTKDRTRVRDAIRKYKSGDADDIFNHRIGKEYHY